MPKRSQNVPMNTAADRFANDMETPPSLVTQPAPANPGRGRLTHGHATPVADNCNGVCVTERSDPRGSERARKQPHS